MNANIVRSHRYDAGGRYCWKHYTDAAAKEWQWSQDPWGKQPGKLEAVMIYNRSMVAARHVCVVTFGEHDADVINRLLREGGRPDRCATCFADGPVGIKLTSTFPLHHMKRIWIVTSHVAGGGTFGEEVTTLLHDKGPTLYQLGGPPVGIDWADWISQGGTAAEFVRLLETCFPIESTVPPAPSVNSHDGDVSSASSANIAAPVASPSSVESCGSAASAVLPPDPTAAMAVTPAATSDLPSGRSVPQPAFASATFTGETGGRLQEWHAADLAERYLDARGYVTPDGLLLRKHQGQWLSYRHGSFRPVPTEELLTDILAFVHETPARKNASRALASNVAKNMEPRCLISESVALPAQQVSPREWRSMPGTLIVQNGIVSLDRLLAGQERVFVDHTPRIVSRYLLGFPYDADAECPRWQRFLEEILPDPDSRAFLQQFFGYCLTPGNWRQRFVIFQGSGANGKSVAAGMLRRLLDPRNVSSVPLNRFDAKHDLVSMHNKLLNICPELGERDHVAEDILKKITGGDPVHFDPKYEKQFSAPRPPKSSF
jgi:hypothetical protein